MMYIKSVDYFDLVSATTTWFLDLVFPPRCLGCGTFTNNTYLCKRCFRSFPIRRSQECIGCKAPTTLGITCLLCRRHRSVDQLIIASSYTDRLLVRTITTWKYRFIAELTHPMQALLRKQIAYLARQRKFSLLGQNPLMVAVPLTPYRERWRGFNQAQQLAQHIADTFQLMTADTLIRIKDAPPQTQMSDRAERLTNVVGLFRCTGSSTIAGRDVLLVDDVCTTGATLDACAQVLKQNGARSVTALVVARG